MSDVYQRLEEERKVHNPDVEPENFVHSMVLAHEWITNEPIDRGEYIYFKCRCHGTEGLQIRKEQYA